VQYWLKHLTLGLSLKEREQPIWCLEMHLVFDVGVLAKKINVSPNTPYIDIQGTPIWPFPRGSELKENLEAKSNEAKNKGNKHVNICLFIGHIMAHASYKNKIF